jgi:putative addiction module killer protein
MLLVKERAIVILQDKTGKYPFEIWFKGLKDVGLQNSVDARLSRVADGNFGDHKSVGFGVYELRIDKGPGLRIYYGLMNDILVIIIGGGSKDTQRADIRKCQILWEDYLNANKAV